MASGAPGRIPQSLQKPLRFGILRLGPAQEIVY